MSRLLRRGGVAVIATWRHTYLAPLLLAVLERRNPSKAATVAAAAATARPSPWSDAAWIAELLVKPGAAVGAKRALFARVVEARASDKAVVVREDEVRSFAEFLAAMPGVGRILAMQGWTEAERADLADGLEGVLRERLEEKDEDVGGDVGEEEDAVDEKEGDKDARAARRGRVVVLEQSANIVVAVK
ncbi:hypothetical protein DFJ73DRAFT_836405, partial [Zopfochytrium polystomum]